MKIDMNKKYTSNGRDITILCTNRNNEYPVVGLLEDGSIRYFTESGKHIAGDTWNLVEAWKPQEGEWCLFWDDGEYDKCIVARFVKMTESGRFYNNGYDDWQHCAKFNG
jgi:hypothetical protein